MKNPYENQIEIIARAVIINDGKLLLNKWTEAEHYFFPGGHVEYGEFMEDALVREINEELGVKIVISGFIGLSENMFEDERTGKHHEINIVFSGEIKDENIRSLEDHLEYRWISLKDFENTKILPATLKESIKKWINDQHHFQVKEGANNG